jgi:hypothetical protein
MEHNVVYIDQEGVETLVGHERISDVFGIPLQFATQFWKDDPRGEIAKFQIVDLYGPKIAACIEKQKKDGTCFSSIKEAKEKFNNRQRYYVDALLHLYLDPQRSSDTFFTSEGEQDGICVVMGMSTGKLILHKVSTEMLLNEGQQLRVWGYLIEIPRGFQIKPYMVWYK